MARKIVITSGKGGVGKTTITANLGFMLASTNKRVALFDVDIGLNNLDVVLGVENKVVYDIVDVIEGKCRPKQALIQHFEQSMLYIMPSSHLTNADRISSRDIKNVIDSLNDFFDYILIDCPAGIDLGFQRAVYSADEALVVCTPHISSIRDADKVVSILSSYKLSNVSVIVNRVRGDMILNNESFSVEDVAKMLKVPLVSAIPEDDDISTLSIIGRTVKKDSQSYRAFDLLASNINNNTRYIFNCTKKYSGLFGGIIRKLKKRV